MDNLQLIVIRHRYTGAVLYSGEHESLSGAVVAALESGTNLSKANLSKANLSKANLFKADLSWADLSESDLSGANLSESDLSKANLSGVKTDLFDVLSHARNEVGFLLAELEAGRINGSVYEGGCCCLIGTIAKHRGSSYNALDGIYPNSARQIERWFLAIQPGDTPENSQVAKITADWIREFLGEANV